MLALFRTIGLQGKNSRRHRRFLTTNACPDVLVCGAGVAGIASAYHLAHDFKARVVVLDERPPCSFTSSMSTEAFRNFWSDETMTIFMNRSIDLLVERARRCGNKFSLSQNGYAFISANKKAAQIYETEATQAEKFGTGKLTKYGDSDIHVLKQNYHVDPITQDVFGTNLILGNSAIRKIFPYLSSESSAIMFARRCGWMNAQQHGTQIIQEAREAGAKFVRGKLISLTAVDGRTISARVLLPDGGETVFQCGAFVNAAGPFAQAVHSLVVPGNGGGGGGGVGVGVGGGGGGGGVGDLKLKNFVHAKVVMRDSLGIVPPDAPMLIWDDPINLPWTDEERAELGQMGPLAQRLTGELPGGVHMRPYPGGFLVMLWDFAHAHLEVAEPPPEEIFFEEIYPEIVIRGLSTMVPGMKTYLENTPPITVDGGYYTKSPDNKPLIGSSTITNYYICGGLSGYGVMGCAAAGELLAQHVAKSSLPGYAKDFDPMRFSDPNFKVVKSKAREL